MWFNKKLRLFWWNEVKIQQKKAENYGDLIGRYLVEKISRKDVVWVKPSAFSIFNWFSPIFVTVGSVLTHINKYCIVWGSGIISKEYFIHRAEFLAVRGPQTRKHLIGQGFDVPEIYGDPALLLPDYFHPRVEKKYEYGIIPHYNDMHLVKEWFKGNDKILIIDLMTNDVESKTKELLSCKKIVSSSLHGIIVAHAYQIPAVWQKFSEKIFGDDIKYQDYMESVVLAYYKPMVRTVEYTNDELEALFVKYPSLPSTNTVEQLKKDLMDVCPFKN